MTRAASALLLALAACGSTNTTVPSGQLSAPSGLAAVSAGDRDLVFIANSGRDGLVAFQLCSKLQPDGGVDPNDTCSPSEDAQYVPGPIRVLTGTIETGDRTARVAGARLSAGAAADGGTIENGEALTVGVDENLRVVDARVLVAAQERRVDASTTNPVLKALPLNALGVDIVAVNEHDDADVEKAAPSVKVFVATVAPASLIALTATLDATGNAQLPTVDAKCDLGSVVPNRIAVAPGKTSDIVVYVADGSGDGVVSVPASGIAGGACPMQRISAGGRSVASLALSPRWYETNTTDSTRPNPIPHTPGEILMMVLEPLPGSTAGRQVDPGGVLFARTSDGAILPVPGFPYSATGQAPMQPLVPLQPSGKTAVAREATFLRSFTCSTPPCTPLYLGASTTGTIVGDESFDLLAAVGGSDGTTTFIDVPNRHFVTPNSFVLPFTPTALDPAAAASTLQPAQSDPNAATIELDTTVSVAGVSRNSTWRVIWHGPIPGLERRAGTLTRTGAGTARFVTSPANLDAWKGDPVLQLGAGDAAVVASASSGDAACKDVVAAFNAAGTLGTEFTITAVPAADSIDLREPATGVVLTDACTSVGVTFEIRTAGAQPWLIYDGSTAVGRWHTGEKYFARQTRYDYPFVACSSTGAAAPRCYSASASDPRATSDVAFAFTISGNDPAGPAAFTIALAAPLPSLLADVGVTAGLPSGILPYSSPRHPSLLFVSLAGANEILQADPSVLGSVVGGFVAYR